MVLSIKIVILQCMLALLIGVNSAVTISDTQILLDDKLSVEGFSFFIDADKIDLDGDTDFSFFEQTQLNNTKYLSIRVSLFALPKALGRLHSTPSIRAPPNPIRNT